MNEIDITIKISKNVWLELKETRGTSMLFTKRDGFDEVESRTSTRFQWRLHGMAGKIDHTTASKDELMKNQELYDITISSEGFDIRVLAPFKSREAAIRNALEFAKRNGFKIDGYSG